MNFLDRLGLGRRDLRAWAMYDWANSAFQTTIIAAVFPIYFHKVAAANLPPAVATSRFAWATTIAILIVAVIAPLLGAIADLRRGQEEAARRYSWSSGSPRRSAMYWIERGDWQLALVLFVDRQRRRRRQHRVLRVAAAAPGRRVDARPGVVGRLCGRIPRRRHAARDQPADDPEAGDRSASPTPGSRPASRWPASACGGWCSRSRCSGRFRSRPYASPPASGRPATWSSTGIAPARHDVPRAAQVPAGVPAARRLPALQRRHPDDRPDGDDLRQRS